MQHPLLIILGNQLFPVSEYIEPLRPCSIFMAEDFELCTRFKIHKLKIMMFLSAMRHYGDELVENKFNVHYEKLSKHNIGKSYEDKLHAVIEKTNPSRLIMYEIEDKFFEERIIRFSKVSGLEIEFLRTPSFMTSRESFRDYLGDVKKPFMKTFYERERRRHQILMDGYHPIGGKFSFDSENRKKRPLTVSQPSEPRIVSTKHTQEVEILVADLFGNHPGETDFFWTPVTRKMALDLLKQFIDEKLDLFGPYQDAIESNNKFSFHSALSTSINLGLITPREVIARLTQAFERKKINLCSVEGFIRQVMGWREFIRGIYQNFSEQQERRNFFNHQRRLTQDWYKGTTGIPPLDDTIRFINQRAYTNHIDRLMILGNMMLLCEIRPLEAHQWFMEQFVDSMEWVMGPNVYGMGIFSDGGIFATKPYIAGSNYMRKMSHYKIGPWCDTVDGLYWRFVEKNSDYLVRNPRTSMMVRTFQKIPLEKKTKIYNAAANFLSEKTSL